jgi:hypothetical protein
MRPLVPSLWLVGTLVAGCAAPGFRPLQTGMTEADAARVWGPPTGRHALPVGTRLEWATGPEGAETWMVDLDPNGRVLRWRQVLSYDHLRAVQGDLPGLDTPQLLATLGRPAQRRPDRLGGEVWSWRHASPFCLWFQASLDPGGRVRDATFAPDPRCDEQDR